MWNRPNPDSPVRHFSFTTEEVTLLIAIAGIQKPSEFSGHETKALIHKCTAVTEHIKSNQRVTFEVRR